MQILVLTKPVPDPAAGAERLGPDGRLDRAASPSRRQRQRRVRARGRAPARGGARRRGRDPRRWRRPTRPTRCARRWRWAPRAASSSPTGARGRRPADDDPRPRGGRGRRGVRPPARRRRHLRRAGRCRGRGRRRAAGLPLLSTAGAIEPDPAAGTVRVRRLSAKGYDVIEAPMPAVISCTQALGAPRYPTSRGSWPPARRRSRRGPRGPARCRRSPPRRLGDQGRRRATAAPHVRRTRRQGATRRGGARGRRLPRRPEAHLMAPVILVVGEVADGTLTRLSTEIATLARAARGRRRAGAPWASSSMPRRTPPRPSSPRTFPVSSP